MANKQGDQEPLEVSPEKKMEIAKRNGGIRRRSSVDYDKQIKQALSTRDFEKAKQLQDEQKQVRTIEKTRNKKDRLGRLFDGIAGTLQAASEIPLIGAAAKSILLLGSGATWLYSSIKGKSAENTDNKLIVDSENKKTAKEKFANAFKSSNLNIVASTAATFAAMSAFATKAAVAIGAGVVAAGAAVVAPVVAAVGWFAAEIKGAFEDFKSLFRSDENVSTTDKIFGVGTRALSLSAAFIGLGAVAAVFTLGMGPALGAAVAGIAWGIAGFTSFARKMFKKYKEEKAEKAAEQAQENSAPGQENDGPDQRNEQANELEASIQAFQATHGNTRDNSSEDTLTEGDLVHLPDELDKQVEEKGDLAIKQEKEHEQKFQELTTSTMGAKDLPKAATPDREVERSNVTRLR